MAEAFSLRGQCYNQMGDFQRALYDFSVAIRIEKDNYSGSASAARLSEYCNHAGVQHYMLAQLEEALNHYNTAIELNPNNGEYLYNRGLVKSRLDMVEDAIKDYEASLKNLTSGDDESVYQTHFNKGICLRRIGRLEESIADLEKAKTMKADRAAVHNNLGLSYFENEMFDEALQCYTKAIQIDLLGAHASVHYNNRGLAYYHNGMQEEAKDDFDIAIEKDPHDPTIYFNRGNVFLNWKEKQQFDLAHKDYDMALEIAPTNAKLWHSKGLAFQGQAEVFKNPEYIDRAIEMYKQAISLQDNFVSSRFHLGLMYHKIQ